MFNTCYDRELSGCSERHVRRAISSNVQCLQLMCLQRKLEAHAGCVNTVSFDTEGGDVLISGSDDQKILLWDWQRGTVRLRFDSGHANNIFQARMLPHSSGSRLITCAADGQVRLVELPEGAGSLSVAKTLLGEHMGRAHKLALDPLNPGCCFYSSGEDGQVLHYDLRCGSGPSQQHQQQQQQQPSGSSSSSSSSRRSGSRLKLLLCQGYSKARGPTNRVVGINAIHVNPTRPWQFAVGGSDAWARVYDLRKTRDPPQNPSSSSGVNGGSGSDLAAAADAAAACNGRDCYWIRSSSSSIDATAAGEQQQQQRIGPPTRAEVRYSRVYGLADEPVARLCPEPLWGARASGFGGDPSITCVMFSQQGELLASYNDDDIYMFSSQASRGSFQLNSSSSDAAGNGGSSNGSGSSSRARQDSAAAAPAAVGGDGSRQQQQQQQQRSSPYRRSRAEADAAAAQAAAAGDAINEQQTDCVQPGSEQQQQQQDGGSDVDEQPRWKRRQQQQQLLQTDIDSRPAAAVAASEGSRQDEVDVSGQPLAAAATAAVSPVRRIGAVLEEDNLAAAEAGEHPLHQQQQRQQQQWQQWWQQQWQRQPCCGPGRGFGTPAARFFGGGVGSSGSSRDGVVACYYGHRNAATVKGVSYFGESDEYVVSGSDCGHVFVWSKAGGEVVWWAAGDEEVVNCLEPHPLLPHVLATSGIEHDIKIWAPTAPQPQPPNPTSLRAAMAANRRGREASREVMSEPEQWLLQLLAAQRRRSRATERLRRAEAAAGAAGRGGSGHQAAATQQQQQHTHPTAAAAAAGSDPDHDMFAEEHDEDDDDDANAEEEDSDELAANPFSRLLARPRALRLRFAGDEEEEAAAATAGVGGGGRQRHRRVVGAAAAGGSGGDGEGGVSSSSSEEGDGQESDGGGGDDDRPCYVN